MENNMEILGLQFLCEMIRQKLGLDAYSEVSFENDTFVIRPYCWCDGEKEGHEEGCPSNFEYKKGNFWADWYKHIGRGFACDDIGATEFANMLSDCLGSL